MNKLKKNIFIIILFFLFSTTNSFAEMVNKIEPKREIKKILITLLFDIVFTSSIELILYLKK